MLQRLLDKEASVCYSSTMPITKEEWEKLTWRERVALATNELQIGKKALAQRIGVSPRTMRRWESNELTPSIRYARALMSLCVKSKLYDIKDEAFMAMHSLSADASSTLLTNASQSSDPVMRSMATYCIAVKFAAVVQNINAENIIIRTSSLFGAPYNTTVQMQSTAYPVEKRAVEVIIGQPASGQSLFIISTTLLLDGAPSSKFAFTATDRAILQTAKRIISFLLS